MIARLPPAVDAFEVAVLDEHREGVLDARWRGPPARQAFSRQLRRAERTVFKDRFWEDLLDADTEGA